MRQVARPFRIVLLCMKKKQQLRNEILRCVNWSALLCGGGSFPIRSAGKQSDSQTDRLTGWLSLRDDDDASLLLLQVLLHNRTTR